MMITWITLKQPATRRDAVGDVYDLIWLDSVKIPKERIAKNGCVEFGHAVHFVGSHKTQIGHANSLIDIVREDGRVRHDFEQIRVVLESILNELHKVPIDVADDLRNPIPYRFVVATTWAAIAP